MDMFTAVFVRGLEPARGVVQPFPVKQVSLCKAKGRGRYAVALLDFQGA